MTQQPTFGLMERSLAVFPGWQIGRERAADVDRRGLFGSIAKVRLAPLGEIEMSVLARISHLWMDQGAPTNGVVRFTWYQLCRDLWPDSHDSGGKYRAMARRAVDNLLGAVVTLGGFNVHDGQWSDSRFSDVHILNSVTGHVTAADDPREGGGAREDTVEVSIAPWLVAQLLGNISYVGEFSIERSLGGGTPRRLWYFLGGRADAFKPGAWPGEETATFDVDDELFEILDLRAARPSGNRETLKRAAARIQERDPNYVRLVVERNPERRGAWQLRAVRKVADVEVLDAAA